MPDWEFPKTASGRTGVAVAASNAAEPGYVMEVQQGGNWCWAAVTAAVASKIWKRVVTQHEIAWAHFKPGTSGPPSGWCRPGVNCTCDDQTAALCNQTADTALVLEQFDLLKGKPVSYPGTQECPFVLRLTDPGDPERGHVVIVLEIGSDRAKVLDPMGPETADGHTLPVVLSPASRLTVLRGIPYQIVPVKP